ncbi:MAG: flagellar export chaperone FliS [Acidimicrobiales bacterium]|jgi:flagellar protein FliS
MALTEQDVANAYSDTAAKTVNSGPMLIVRLYDRLAHDVELARRYIEANDYENADSCLQHAQKIVIVLRTGLRPAGFHGGDDLRRLYNTLIDLLVKANLFKDLTVIGQCQGIIAPLHAAWMEAVAIELEKGEAGGATAGVA